MDDEMVRKDTEIALKWAIENAKKLTAEADRKKVEAERKKAEEKKAELARANQELRHRKGFSL